MEALFASAPSVAAFLAGVLSFISPCVLPLVPGYLSFVSGVSLDEMRGTAAVPTQNSAPVRRRMLLASIFFVLGFSLVFVTLGASATALGQYVMERSTLLGKVAGIVIIIFGLHTMGVLRIGWLYQEKRFQQSSKPAGLIGSLLVGIAFAFGWTPCIGPILASILAIAGTQETVGQGVQLLSVYSAGLAIPFLLTTLAIDRFFAAFARIRRHYHKVEIVSGALMIAIGVLIFTNNLTVIVRYLEPYLPYY
jgi:cytochrome c-type biogenesis protein